MLRTNRANPMEDDIMLASLNTILPPFWRNPFEYAHAWNPEKLQP